MADSERSSVNWSDPDSYIVRQFIVDGGVERLRAAADKAMALIRTGKMENYGKAHRALAEARKGR